MDGDGKTEQKFEFSAETTTGALNGVFVTDVEGKKPRLVKWLLDINP